MTEKTQLAGLPTASKVLCAVYALTSLVALVATWSQNLAYWDAPNFIAAFANDTKVTPAARSLTVDLFLLAFPAVILMVAEARKHRVRYVWAYVLAGAVTAISVTFPLFLIARELRIAQTDPTVLRRGDTIPLAILGIATAAIVIWVDVG
ncbi:DUF2834 domain-containing protein [Mycolicibacterium gadium]|uniref:DUF2834 domain-containing protein n=1 Tax=Mycolicibacterium gadium TaxID=1794 RepID=A0A7I7WMY4_MYCGU|nr:DUF2834 domain-containing protein [Mycolicibacterium gadium]BBZ17228.1 hypothetical protein MGAD_15630 [Mycolicibacterium gadium]